MLDTKIGNPANLDLSFEDRIFDSSPAFQSRALASERGMQQKQIDVSQATFLDAFFDGRTCRFIVRVSYQFRSIVDVLPSDVGGVCGG